MAKIKKFRDIIKNQKELVVYESEYLIGEPMEISNDIYNLFIAANMTKNCNPRNLNFAIKYCVLVFIIQCTLAFYYSKVFLKLDEFQPF